MRTRRDAFYSSRGFGNRSEEGNVSESSGVESHSPNSEGLRSVGGRSFEDMSPFDAFEDAFLRDRYGRTTTVLNLPTNDNSEENQDALVTNIVDVMQSQGNPPEQFVQSNRSNPRLVTDVDEMLRSIRHDFFNTFNISTVEPRRLLFYRDQINYVVDLTNVPRISSLETTEVAIYAVFRLIPESVITLLLTWLVYNPSVYGVAESAVLAILAVL